MTPLRRRMIEEFQIRRYAPGTQQSYLNRVSRFAQHFSRSPGTMMSGQQGRGWPQRRITLDVAGQLIQVGLPWPIAGFLVEFSLGPSLRKVNPVAASE